MVISIGDQGGTVGNKIQSIGIMFASMVMSALLGAISYIYPVTILPIAFVAAFITAMPFGGHWFMFHKVLTCFLPVYVGLEPRSIGEPVASTAIAGCFVFAWSLLPELLGTYEGIRTELFQAWLQLGRTTTNSPIAQFAVDEWEIRNIINDIPTSATKKILMTFDTKRYSSNTYNDKTKKKIQTLVKALDIVRCGFIILLIKEKASCDEMPQFQRAVGNLCRLIAHSCQNSWLIYIPCYKRRIENALEEVNGVVDPKIMASLSEQGREDMANLIKTIVSTMQEVVKVVEEPWQRSSVPNILKDVVAIAKLPTYSPRRAMWIYCVRISIVYTLATIPMFFEIGYQDFGQKVFTHWFPMTVSIISMPGIGSTIKKVVYRTSGTVLGVLLGALGMYLIEITLPNNVLAVILFSVIGFWAIVFYTANYAIA